MKKRLISLLLTLVMLVSLCPALAATASADATVTTVTLNSGDTVLGLCQKLGVDYYAHKNLIMSLNGLTSEAQFSKLHVGSQINLPVSNAAAASLSSGGVGVGTTATAPTTGTVTGTGVVSGTTSSIPAGDYVSYYLVSYTIQPGETIAGIYNNWGLSYKTYSNQILKLNNISSYNSIPAGKALILPTTNPAIAGSAYTTVMAHVMRSGDSAYNIICSDYGLNYNAVQKQVQALNNRENLAQFMVGEVLYIPVTGLVSSNTVVTPGTGSSSSSATINGSAAFNLVSQTPTNGTFSLMVDGVAANSAYAGKTVEIVATPNAGYAVSAISVTKVGDANTVVALSGNKFVMPSFSVSINVTFSQAIVSDITVDKAVNGGVTAMVNGAAVQSATAGNLVTVKTIPATGFMLDAIRVTYNDYRDTVAVENGQFVMPTFPVTITATFKEDPNYDPNKGHNIYVDAVNGTVVAKVGENEVSSAKAGDRVALTVTPNENYTLQSLTVYYDNFTKTADVEKNAFTMPDGPVTIVANIKPTSDAAFIITKVSNSDGKLSVTVDGEEVTSAKVGAKVQITGSSAKSYYNYIPTVFKTGDTSVTVPVAEDGSFTMPDFPVTVSIKFYVYHNIYLDASNGTNGWFNVTAAMNGMAIGKCGAGVELKVTVWGYNQSTHAPGNVIVTYADGSVHDFSGTNFIMPDCDIKVRVNFNPVQSLVAHAPTNVGSGKAGNSYTVLGYKLTDGTSSSQSIRAGEKNTVVVTPNCAIGYQVDSIYYSYTDDKGTVNSNVPVNISPVTGKYQFEMPKLAEKTSLDLYVSFRQIANYKISVEYVGDNAANKMGTVQVLSSLGHVTSAVEDAKINLRFAPNDGYSVDYANVKVLTSSGREVELNRNDYSFFMPAEPVTVYVAFKDSMHTVKLALAATPDGDSAPKGFINALVNGTKYTDSMLTVDRLLPVEVEEGTVVTIINESRLGFILDPNEPIKVTRVNTGVPIEVTVVDPATQRFSFVMPDDDVEVVAQYVDDMYSIVTTESANGSITFPVQAFYSADVPVYASNISPAPGFELSAILVSYIDHLGNVHDKEALTNGTGFIPAGGGIPQSVVTFEAVFEPALNPLTIKYVFDSAPSSSSNYAVDLLIANNKVEGIQRNTQLADGTVADVLNADKTNGYGLPTGATVVISPQTHNADKNFSIVNISIEHEGKAILPEFSNGQYFFTVPYVSTMKADGLVLSIRYAKEVADSFNLTAYAGEGAQGSATAKFYVDNAETTYAQPNKAIKVELKADEHSQIVTGDGKAKLCYIDSDNVSQRKDLTVNADGTIDIPASTITSLPISKTVSVEYMTTHKGYEISTTHVKTNGDSISANVSFTDAQGNPLTAPIPWGQAVTAVPSCAGYTATEIIVKTESGETIDTNNGFMFTMPQENVTVTVVYAPVGYTATLSYAGTGLGSTQLYVGETPYGNNDVIPYQAKVYIVPTADESSDSVCSSISVNDGACTVQKDSEGKFFFEMPAENVDVKTTFTRNTYTLKHHIETGSDSVNYTLEVYGVAYTKDQDAKVAFGKPVVVKPAEGFMLEKAIFTYKDKSGNDVTETLTSFSKDEDGNSTIAIGKIPQAGSTVSVGLSFRSVNTKYSVTDVSGCTHPDVSFKINGSYDSGVEIYQNNVVTLDFKLRYNRAFDGKVTYSYKDGVGADQTNELEIKFIGIDGDGKCANYRATFTMPSSDVTVSYKLDVPKTINVSCTGGTVDTALTTVNKVVITPDANVTVSKPVASYNNEGKAVFVDGTLDTTTGNYVFDITSIPEHKAFGNQSQLNLVTVTLN